MSVIAYNFAAGGFAASQQPAAITAVGIDDVATVNVYLYPNPTRDYVTIVADEVITVEVFDVVGRKVATYANTNRIDLSALEFGNNTLRIRHAHRRVVKTN